MAHEKDESIASAASPVPGSFPGPIPVLLNAATAGALAIEVRELEQVPEVELAQLSRRLVQSRTGEHRLAIVADSTENLAIQLRTARQHLVQPRPPVLKTRSGIYYGFGAPLGKTAVLFPGQGSQYPGMLRELCVHVPGVRAWFDELDSAFLRAGARRPTELLSTGAAAEEVSDERLFGLEGGAQLGLAASLALYAVLVRMGVRGDFLLGHSNGEHAALMAAETIRHTSVREACEFMCRVALESTRLPEPPIAEGVMAVGGLRRPTVEQVVSRYREGLYLAVDNCPTQVVLAGYRHTLQEAWAELRRAGGICSWLPFARAHHTPLFADWTRLLEKHYENLDIGRSRAIVYSCGTAQEYPADRGRILKLLASQWSGAVRFRESVEALYQAGARIFIEAGPDNRLTPFVDDILRGKAHRSLSASNSSRGDLMQLAHLAAELYSIGVPASLEIFPAPAAARQHNGPAALEKAALTRRVQPAALAHTILQEHAATAQLAAESASRIAGRIHGSRLRMPARNHFPLLGEAPYRDGTHLRVRRTFTVERDPFLRDHCLGRGGRGERGTPLPVLAFTMSMEIAAEAAYCMSGMPICSLAALRAHNWLAVETDGLTVDVEADVEGTGIHVRIFALSETNRVLSFEAAATVGNRIPTPSLEGERGDRRPPVLWDRERFYRDYAFHGPSFQGIERVEVASENEVAARIMVTELRGLSQDRLQLDPAVLDCAGQLAALWCLENGRERLGAYPFQQRELMVFAAPKAPGNILYCRGKVRRTPFGTLSSDFEFASSDGLVLSRIHSLEQRLVPLPHSFWNVLYGRSPVSVTVAALLEDNAADWSTLTRQSTIWARALAHLVLPPEEWRQWRRLPAADSVARLREILAAQYGRGEAAVNSPAAASASPW